MVINKVYMIRCYHSRWLVDWFREFSCSGVSCFRVVFLGEIHTISQMYQEAPWSELMVQSVRATAPGSCPVWRHRFDLRTIYPVLNGGTVQILLYNQFVRFLSLLMSMVLSHWCMETGKPSTDLEEK